MSSSLLFWGFQDLNFISEVAKKARYSINSKDFYIQINDLEKTISLMDLYPEEIIRTKYDLNNLYQWLVRSAKKNILVIIDLFNLVFYENLEENCSSLKKIISLDFKIYFISPKILHPQTLKFVENQELNSIYQKTVYYTKSIKFLHEIIINSGENVNIISTPVPEFIVINRENYFLFEMQTKYYISFFPKILKQFNAAYISQNAFVTKVVETISSILLPLENKDKFILNDIEADSVTQYGDRGKDTMSKFKPMLSVSLEKFFNLKSSTSELNFILWLIYISICEYEIKAEKNSSEPILSDLFFASSSIIT